MSIEKLHDTLSREQITYTQVANEAIHLIKDAETLGVYLYLLSRPSDWNPNKKEIANSYMIVTGKQDTNRLLKFQRL